MPPRPILEDAVGTNPLARLRPCSHRCIVDRGSNSSRCKHRPLEQRRRADGGRHERTNFLFELIVAGACGKDEGIARGFRLLERGGGNRLDAKPRFASHALRDKTRSVCENRLSVSYVAGTDREEMAVRQGFEPWVGL